MRITAVDIAGGPAGILEEALAGQCGGKQSSVEIEELAARGLGGGRGRLLRMSGRPPLVFASARSEIKPAVVSKTRARLRSNLIEPNKTRRLERSIPLVLRFRGGRPPRRDTSRASARQRVHAKDASPCIPHVLFVRDRRNSKEEPESLSAGCPSRRILLPPFFPRLIWILRRELVEVSASGGGNEPVSIRQEHLIRRPRDIVYYSRQSNFFYSYERKIKNPKEMYFKFQLKTLNITSIIH